MQPLQHWLKPRVPSNAWRHGPSDWTGPAWQPWALGNVISGWKRTYPWLMDCRRKVVSTNASNMGWGTLCEGWPACGLRRKGSLCINCLDMLAVCWALHVFLPNLKGHYVLVHSESMTVVAYINHHEGLSSRCLFTLVEHLLEWEQHNLHLLSAMKTEPGHGHAVT